MWLGATTTPVPTPGRCSAPRQFRRVVAGTMGGMNPPSWGVIVPGKLPEVAKPRLADLAGSRRPAIARAFAADTVAAALACPEVAEVVVVTDDVQTAEAVTAMGATVVDDAPDAGLNAALRHGAQVARGRRPGAPTAALSADLPALRPDVDDAVDLWDAVRLGVGPHTAALAVML